MCNADTGHQDRCKGCCSSDEDLSSPTRTTSCTIDDPLEGSIRISKDLACGLGQQVVHTQVVTHDVPPFTSFSEVRSLSRPRRKCDFTVLVEQPIRSAISTTGRPS